jgi:uncharacterized protein
MAGRVLRWTALAWPGWEHLELVETATGVTARSVLIGEREGVAYGARYEVQLDAAWVFRTLDIMLTDDRTLHLASDGRGHWSGQAGMALPELEGCIDIDLSGSPFTNTLPLRRAKLEIGMPRHFRMAWIPLHSLEPVRDEQIYTRLGNGRVRYQSADLSFERELTVDTDDFVLAYPGLFERM